MSEQPNIIFIMTDTQATNMVSSYTNQPTNTNHIDMLAKDGYQFTSAYTCAPVCTPARAGIFTGIYSNQSGPWANNIPLGKNVYTMGDYFKGAGYKTCYIGKWHLDGHDYFGTGECPDEWDPDYWFDGANYLSELSEQEIELWRNGLNSAEEMQANNISASFTWAHKISDRAIQYLTDGRHSSSPFLLVLSYDEPHHPFTCPAEYIEKYQDFYYPLGKKAFDDLENKPLHQRLWSQAMPAPKEKAGFYHHPLYFGCNDFVDDQIGRVLDKVDELSIDNTWIIYTSDHGEMMGAHKLISKGATAYDDITRIPLIIHPPKGYPLREKLTVPVSHIDILPTLLKIAGLDVPNILQGEDLLDIAKDRSKNRGVMIEFNRYEIEHDSFGGFIPMRAWVENDYKLVINLFTSDELYDRNNDPNENHNLINDDNYQLIRNQLHDNLLAYMDRIRDPFRTFQWATRPWRQDKKPLWMGAFRPKPNDLHSPVIRDYDTGLPTQGTKIEHKSQKF